LECLPGQLEILKVEKSEVVVSGDGNCSYAVVEIRPRRDEACTVIVICNQCRKAV